MLIGLKFSRKPKWATFFPGAEIISKDHFERVWWSAQRSSTLWGPSSREFAQAVKYTSAFRRSTLCGRCRLAGCRRVSLHGRLNPPSYKAKNDQDGDESD